MFRCIVSALVLVLAAAPCRAAGATTFVYSYGLKSCGAFVAATGTNPPGVFMTMKTADGRTLFDESAIYKNWLLGYLTAVNVMRDDSVMPSIELDNEAIDLWMRNWCNAHPTSSMFDGARAFVAEEYSRQK